MADVKFNTSLITPGRPTPPLVLKPCHRCGGPAKVDLLHALPGDQGVFSVSCSRGCKTAPAMALIERNAIANWNNLGEGQP